MQNYNETLSQSWSQEANSACLTSRRSLDRAQYRPPISKDLRPKNTTPKTIENLPESGSRSLCVTYLCRSCTWGLPRG
jgi:hypothetical protein